MLMGFPPLSLPGLFIVFFTSADRYTRIREYTHKPCCHQTVLVIRDGAICPTAGCALVLVRVWGCLVVPGMCLRVFGIWVNVA